MKIKVKCPTCKREHLVTIPDKQPIMEIKTITCLSCSVIIRYRIGKPKADKDINNDLFEIFNRKSPDLANIFKEVFKRDKNGYS